VALSAQAPLTTLPNAAIQISRALINILVRDDTILPRETFLIDERYLDPSLDSAGYDLNKIIRTEYDEPLYATMGKILTSTAIRTWNLTLV
jgi:hypothetical protein